MTCAGCGHANPDQAKFCLECGAALGVRCAQCGTELPPAAKFCLECGARTAAAPPPAREGGARKVVSIVFADLVGSTALHERLDAESARRLMERYYAALRGAVDAHGGTVVKLLGDGVMAAFGIRQVAEDDAERAVRAAAAMQTAFRALVQEQAAVVGSIGLRVAVNTGEVVVSGAHDDLIGDPVNVAARLQEKGGDGDVVVGEDTHRLVATRMTLEPLGSLALKGRAETVDAYRLVSLDPPAGAAAAPFVGRAAELGRLDAVFAAVVGTPATRLAVLLGSPGLGKSRLIDELARRHDQRATLLSAHCDAGGGATFAPLATALRAHLGLEDAAAPDALRAAIDAALHGDDADRARVAAGVAALLAGSPAAPEETFFVVRRFLAALAGQRPVLLVIDDLHWAEPLLLDLVEHLVQWGAGVPLFVLVGARPELRDLRAPLAAPGGLVADVVTLAGLDAGAAMRLAANVIGAADLPAAVAAKVLATSEGNPLFVGELVRMLVQEGALTRDGERWTVGAGLAELEMPPTIHALLAARIERLRPPERQVLERAAVIGRHFSRGAVAALLPRETADLDARIEALRRGELIERDSGWLLGEPALRFHHVLIRDAAYRRLLKETRAELHGRLADWIEAQAGEAAEHDETIGRHLEQAHELLGELGPLDPAGRALGARAATRLAAAGRRALASDDVPLAASLLGRAIARLDAADPARAELALDWCEALLAAGDVAQASVAIDDLGRFADDQGVGGLGVGGWPDSEPLTPNPLTPNPRAGGPTGRLRSWHTCFAGQLTVLTEPAALQATADALAAAAAELTALGDAAGEAKAHSVHAQALARLGRVGACEAALDRALAAARKAGDRRRANAVLAGAPVAALWGPSPVTRASGRCLDVVRVLRITQGAPAVEAVALSCQGVLEALRGRTDAARRMLAAARKMVEELGIAHRLHETDAFAGRIAAMEGDTAAAEPLLRGAYDGLRELGLGIDAARAGALLGRVLLAQDRAAEAEALSHESEALAGDDLQAAIAWRGVRAEALARRGEHAAAIELAQAAVGIAATTDALLDHADARLALAAALRAAGRGGDADAEQRCAVELWEAKGATLLAERTRARTAPGAPPAAEPTAAIRRPAPTRLDAPGASPGDGGYGVPTARPVQRRVRPNAASENAARLVAALERQDFDAVERLHDPAVRVVYHPTGSTYGLAGLMETFRGFPELTGLTIRSELLATLGESLALYRLVMSFDSYAMAGASEVELLVLDEVNADGRRIVREIFAADRLDQAIAALYARHADRVPAGAARTRAGATAGSVATLVAVASSHDLTRFAAALSPAVAAIDHRQLGLPPSRGAAALTRDVGALFELAADVGLRSVDVLCLEAGALLQRAVVTGTDRGSGGAFELPLLLLWTFDDAGLLARWEVFDAEREAEALARVDALGAGPPARPVPRRVRANAAAATAARIAAAVAASDLGVIERLCADAVQIVHHPTGRTYGRAELLESFRNVFQAKGITVREETLATLGDALALSRQVISVASVDEGRISIGAVELDLVFLEEVDGSGLRNRAEIFAADHLGDAVARLYQRHAELLPEGPARRRAAVTARTVTYTLTDATTPDESLLFDPRYEDIDHRSVGYGTLSTDEARKLIVTQRALADSLRFRVEDVFALCPDGLVRTTTTTGVWRDGGGAFERTVCMLSLFGPDGRAVRQETFDEGRAADALARFDELTQARLPLARRVRNNRATATLARVDQIVAARDAEALADSLSEELEFVHHPTATTYGRRGMLTTWRSLFRADRLTWRTETLASLGDSLALERHVIAAEGFAETHLEAAGAIELEELCLWEVDAAGRCLRLEVFAADRLGDALVRLYARHAERLPEGPARRRAAGMARSIGAWVGPVDLERLPSVYAPAAHLVDHRFLGTWSARNAAGIIGHFRAQLDLAPDFAARYEDVFAAAADVLVVRMAFFGTARDSGGPFENRICVVLTYDADGRVAANDVYEAEQDAAALARFDALTLPSARRRLRPNAATAVMGRLEAAFSARDLAAIDALLGASMQSVDHTNGVTHGREGHLDSSRRMLRLPDLLFGLEPLATLGERLCLLRRRVSASGTAGGNFDVAEYEMEHVGVLELDDDGLCGAFETFAADQLAAALCRLYERHAALLPEGPARARAAGAARALNDQYFHLLTRDRLGRPFAADVEWLDHRVAGVGALRGETAVLGAVAAFLDLVEDATWRADDVLGCTADVQLTRATNVGTDRTSGGAFERTILALVTFDAGGRIDLWETWDGDRDAEALARFAALAEGETPPLASAFANAASRSLELEMRYWAARDWEGLQSLVSPAIRFQDRRPLFLLDVGFAEFTTQQRLLFEQPRGRWVEPMIATRGERLSLHRVTFEAEVGGGGGPLEIEDHFVVVEVDAGGRWTALVLFDADDGAAAFAELDRRYAAGEGDTAGWRALRAVHGAIERRDWAASTAAFAPRFAVTDRRRLGWGLTLSNAEMFIQSQRSLVELAPDVRYRFDHVRASARGYVTQLAQIGTRDGGPFESPFVYVATLDASGRPQHFDLWDVDGADAAVACYRGLTAHDWEGLRAPLDNTASRADRALFECFNRRDWPGIEALGAPELVFDERRRMLRNTCGRDLWLAQLRVLYDVPASRFTTALLATRGERLSLSLHRFAGDVAGGGGPLSLDGHMALQTVDGDGHLISIVLLDLDDRDAAYAELDARYAAGEATDHPHGPRFVADYTRCFAARDWTALTAIFAPDLVAQSHRLAGWGTVRGPEALVATMRAQIELAPDTRMRMDHVRACAGGAMFAYAWLGTHEGGEFENLYIVVAEVDAESRARRVDVWEHEQLDQALARFASLRGEAPADPLAAIAAGHPATAVLDRWRVSTPGVDADWEALRASLAPGLVFEDRQGFARLAGDGALMIASLRERMASGARAAFRIEGTAGARIAISRMLWTGGPADGRFEIEYLGVTEVDAAGLVVATILFAVDDGRAARREAWARWAAIEPALAATIAMVGEADDAFNAHDRDRLRALFADDLVVEDHRRTGMGRIDGADPYTDSLAVLWDLSPDTRVALGGFWLASDANGGLFTMHRAGNVAGGGPFESDYLMLLRHLQGRLAHMELYELEQRDAALARWTELARAAPPETTAAIARPNAATAAMDRWQAAFAAGDWEAVRALGAPAMTIEDRRWHAQVTYDADTAIADWRIVRDAGARPRRRLVGTAGDRIAVEHLLWSGGPSDGRWEIDFLWLFEVGGDGRFTAAIAFDADDRRAAQREAWARWTALDPRAAAMTAALGEAIDAWNAEDVERLRAGFADDLVVEDHRRTGTGRSEGREAYMRSVEALWQLAPGSRFEAAWHWLAIAPRAGVYPARRFGTLPEGGAFESEFLIVSTVDRGLTTRLEFFEIDAVDAPLARFRELTRHPVAGARPDLLRIPPNAATRLIDETGAQWVDAGALRALVTDDFAFEDHGPHAQVRGGADEMLGGLRFLFIEVRARLQARVVATAGERLVLRHFHWRDRSDDSRFEIERWSITEVDDAGRLRAVILYDLEQRAEAFADLNERYLRGTYPHLVAQHVARRAAGRDPTRLRACLPDDFFFHDHRRTGLGLLESADAYVAALAPRVELSPDALVGQPLYFLAEAEHGTLSIARSDGTRADGGAFESVYAMIMLFRGDRMAGVELFELDDLDAARARFAALAPPSVATPRPDRLRIPPNAAAAAGDRNLALAAAGDWQAVRALHSPSLVFEDRRPGLRTTTDGEAYLAGLRWANAGRDLVVARTLLATAGDRLALHHNRFTRPGEIFEIDTLAVQEFDAEGRLLAVVLFPPYDRAAANAELFERYAALGADGAGPVALEILRAWNTHDLERLRVLLPDDFYLDDRRRTGVGRLDGADAYLASLAAMWELSRDLRTDALYTVADAPHGRLYVSRWSGTNVEGGEFDAVYVCLGLARGDHPVGLEVFELDDLEVARARFTALGAGAARAESE